ncbi:MAG: Flp pilus assembly protein CpaB [Robiginitomaculum sp.]
MDTKKTILLGSLGLLAVVAFLQLQKMGKTVPTKTAAAPIIKTVDKVSYVDVLVAGIDIPMGTRLTSEHMIWKKWPSEALDANLLDIETHPQIIEELTGAVARSALYSGEPIMIKKVVQPGDRGQMAALLGPGMRAVATHITEDSAASGFILPGDRVDIVLTVKLKLSLLQQKNNGSSNATSYASSTIFENVKVLAINQAFNDAEENGAAIVGSTVLLELSQADATALVEAQSLGEISLSLRGLDNRKVGFVPSAATFKRKETETVSSITLYRDGQPQRVAIQGQ